MDKATENRWMRVTSAFLATATPNHLARPLLVDAILYTCIKTTMSNVVFRLTPRKLLLLLLLFKKKTRVEGSILGSFHFPIFFSSSRLPFPVAIMKHTQRGV